MGEKEGERDREGGKKGGRENKQNYIFFKSLQLQQMLMHRAQKRMQTPLSLNEISPHLAAIQSSCISMPGHSQMDEVSE